MPPLQHSEVQGSFELAELEAVGSSLAHDSALPVVVAISVERLNICSVFCLSFLAGGGPSVRFPSDSHSLLLTLGYSIK